MCRETLIELIGHVFNSEFFEEGQEPFKKSDVKNQGQIVIDRFLSGSENAEIQEASVCLTMTAAVVSAFEDLMDKYYDPMAGLKCKECSSRKLIIAENGETPDLLIICENCSYGFLK